jgi:AsmA protein
MKKKILIAIGVVIVVLLIAAIALPAMIDVNKFRPTLETQISAALGRKVSIGNISLSILTGGATIDDLSIADDPAYGKDPFLTAKQLSVGVHLLPLILSRRLEVSSFKIVDPSVTMLRSASGQWNFSTLGAGGGKSSSSGGSSSDAANISVDKIELTNGKIIVGTANSKAKPHEYDGLEMEASDLSYTTQFPFKMSLKTPGGGSLSLDGKAGPMNAKDASQTPLDAKIEVTHLDIATTGFVDPASGMAGIVDFKGNVMSNGQEASTQGEVKIDKLKAVAAGAPATVPVTVDYSTDYDLVKQTGVLKKGDVHIGKALAQLTGNYETKGESASLQMKLNGQGMSVPDLEGVLPAVGVILPSGASLTAGSAQANLTLNGPVDRLTITGPVALSNGKLAGFNLMSKLGALGSFAGLGGKGGSDTEIQTLSADIRQDPTGTHATNLNVVVPSIGTVTGTANIDPAGKLDCKMNAKLSGGAGVMTSKYSPLSGGGSNGIPFKIEGTTKDPIFVPDVAGAATNLVKNPESMATGATGALGGLLGKKKKQ